MNSIKLRIAAKTDVGLVRDNNEDNFQASSDLSIEPMRWVNNEICSLGEKGALLVVADGMGGMNAGEVASELAIETVRSAFRPQNLTEEVMKNRFSIEKFMNSVIVDADKRIKAEAKSHPESRGMGTTIVIAWLLNGKLYVSWCGDSRAYIYNPKDGLHQITKDHSYVQSLIDKGSISKEDAFDYPESNIITRCLSDSPTKAKPESLLQPYDVCDNDIIMLCTDGLSGMIRDIEIEGIIRKNEHDMDICSDVLIKAACDAEGADNITICICQILQGGGICNPQVFEAFDKRISGPDQKTSRISDIISTKITENGKKWNKIIVSAIVVFLAFAVVLGISFKKGQFFNHKKTSKTDSTEVVTAETLSTQTIVSTDGRHFVVVREEGDPQVGDSAYPDGTYTLDPKTTIEIKDSIVVSINTKEDVKKNITEEKIGSEESKNHDKIGNTVKKRGGIFDDYPKDKDGKEMPKDNGNTDGGTEDELTPIGGSVYVDIVHEVRVDENLFSIGKKYGITPDEIRRLNPSVVGNTIKPGDKLRIRYVKIK